MLSSNVPKLHRNMNFHGDPINSIIKSKIELNIFHMISNTSDLEYIVNRMNMNTKCNGSSLCIGIGKCDPQSPYASCDGVLEYLTVQTTNKSVCDGKYKLHNILWHLGMDLPIGAAKTTSALINFLVYPMFGKIIPIILISIFGGLLLKTLHETDKRGRRLKGDNNSGHAQTQRTTLMLLVIIIMYLFAELPQSILIIVCCIVENAFTNYYMHLADMLDLIVLVNCAINFGMYCSMSRQFRECLTESFNDCLKSIKSCCLRKDQATGTNNHANHTTTLTHV